MTMFMMMCLVVGFVVVVLMKNKLINLWHKVVGRAVAWWNNTGDSNDWF